MTGLPLTKRSGLLTFTPSDPGGLILKCLLISTQKSNHPCLLPSQAKRPGMARLLLSPFLGDPVQGYQDSLTRLPC